MGKFLQLEGVEVLESGLACLLADALDDMFEHTEAGQLGTRSSWFQLQPFSPLSRSIWSLSSLNSEPSCMSLSFRDWECIGPSGYMQWQGLAPHTGGGTEQALLRQNGGS